MLLVVVLPALSLAVTTMVCGPTSVAPVGRFAPLAMATPRSVAVQEATVFSSPQENASAIGVPIGMRAPSSGDAIVIVGAIESVKPLSSSARPRSRPVPTGGHWKVEDQPGTPTAATLTPFLASSPRPATFQPACSPQRKPPPPMS